MKVIKIKIKRENLKIVCTIDFGLVGFLLWCDINVGLNTHGFRPADTNGWFSLLFINIFLLGMTFAVLLLTLPDYLAVYTDEGIKWPSLRGYKFIPWSEVTSVEDRWTYWRHRQIVIISSREKICINPDLFEVESEVVEVIRQHVPESVWKQ